MNSTVSAPRRGLTIPLLLEFTLAVAIGMAFQQAVARSVFSVHGNRSNLRLMPYRLFLVGFAATLCLGLAAETSRRRGEPIRWGAGRWTIAAVTASSVLGVGDFLVGLAVECLRGRKVPEPEEIVAGAFIVLSFSLMWIIYFLAGLWLVARLSGRPLRGVVDAREWAGRLVSVGFAASSIAGLVIGERSFRR